MPDTSAIPPTLVVGHPAPDDLRSWLSRRAQADVLMTESPLDHVALSEIDRHSGRARQTNLRPSPTVVLPLDGPIRALAVAARAVRQESNDPTLVVIVLPPDSAPPSLDALRAVAEAGLVPGAELSLVRWVEVDWIWWTTDTGTVRLPIKISSSAARRRSACILTAARGFDRHTVVGRWLDAVAEGSTISDAQQWNAAISAHYVETVSRELRSFDPTIKQPG